jgi:hypothetical protein
MVMTKAEYLRAYLPEPLAAVLALSLLANCFGYSTLADFMHAEARDGLSLLTVLLGASLALWVGLFWISNTLFGEWLSARSALEALNAAYITSITVLLIACLSCIVCAYLKPDHVYSQMFGVFFSIYGLATLPTTLNNTHKLLKLHALFGRQGNKVTDMRSALMK